MTTTRKTPETNGFKGLDDHAHITPAALADATAYDDSGPDAIGYVLTMTAGHLIERAYGPYMLTVSPQLDGTARMSALYVYACHIQAMPIRLDAWLGDPAACSLIGGVAQLMPNGVIGVDADAGERDHRRIRVTGTDTDRRMYGILDAINLPRPIPIRRGICTRTHRRQRTPIPADDPPSRRRALRAHTRGAGSARRRYMARGGRNADRG